MKTLYYLVILLISSCMLPPDNASDHDSQFDTEIENPNVKQDFQLFESPTDVQTSIIIGGKEYITQATRSYFHNTPNVSTRRKAYLEKGDIINPLKEQDSFYYIEFTNPQSLKTSRGWVLKSDFVLDNSGNNLKSASGYNTVINLNSDGSYKFNQSLLTKMSNQEKAIIALIAMTGGTNCEYSNDECMTCQLTDYLEVGCQCSDSHRNYIRKWFNNDKDLEENLDNCYKTPGGATFQKNIQSIKVKRVENTYLVEVDFLELNARYSVSEVVTNTYKFAIEGEKISLL